jgi:hypothetical protein
MPRFLRNGEFHNAGVGKCLLYVHVSRIKQFLFFTAVILRNCEPKDIDSYPRGRMLVDVEQLLGFKMKGGKDVIGQKLGDMASDFLYELRRDEEASEIITDETFVTKHIQRAHVDSFSRAIKCMKQGITLDGKEIQLYF